MTKTDLAIKQIGYELVKHDDILNIFVYENKCEDQRVIIEVDTSPDGDLNDYILHSMTISEYTDYYGHLYNEPMGLSHLEMTLFLAKIEEL